MSGRAPLSDQIAELRMIQTESRKEGLHDRAAILEDTITLITWIEANAATIKLAHGAVTDKAVKAVQSAFPGAEMTGIRA